MARILLTGSNGFVGKALLEFLQSQGHQVVPLSIREEIDQDLNGFDAVIHLAGEPLASGRWTEAKRAKILSSRVESTAKLCTSLAKLTTPPKVFLCASAVGYYGDRGDEILTEASNVGDNFLAHVCDMWELASHSLENTGIRVVHARFGIVLDPSGGALKKLILPTKLYTGATLGSGDQWISFISRKDLIRALEFILRTDTLSGPVNLTTPEPVRQKDFTQKLAKALHRKAFIHLPTWVVKLLFGQMGEEMLLASTRALPEKLQKAKFQFTAPNLDAYLASEDAIDGSSHHELIS